MESTINALDFADEMSPELRAVVLPFVQAPALNTGQQVSCPSRQWMHRPDLLTWRRLASGDPAPRVADCIRTGFRIRIAGARSAA